MAKISRSACYKLMLETHHFDAQFIVHISKIVSTQLHSHHGKKMLLRVAGTHYSVSTGGCLQCVAKVLYSCHLFIVLFFVNKTTLRMHLAEALLRQT
jgi:predicted solute-binding protein